jgi:stress response protein YsnF
MAQQTIVGLYPTRSLAEDVRSRLQANGIPDTDISLGADRGEVPDRESQPKREEGFWDWLFGSDVSEDERDRYSRHLGDGRVAVSVRTSDAAQEKVIAVLEQFDPIDIEGDEGSTGAARPLAGSAAFAAAKRRADASEQPSTTVGDQVIPIVKEELEVGKRQVERRYRIRTHVIETPVEEQVHLRDERVVLERRPATGTTPVSTDALQEHEFEVIERHEEPVVEKRARAVEEVVVHKEAKERLDTVRDTVRETKVDVDKSAPTDKPSLAQTHRDTGED